MLFVPKQISNSPSDSEILPINNCFLFLNESVIPLVIRKFFLVINVFIPKQHGNSAVDSEISI